VTHHDTRSRAGGLERSCREAAVGWIASSAPAGGVELLRAWFAGPAYSTHRHDTYAIGVTDSGIQVFDYRGAARASRPGQVVVLHPDEAHDGRAGTADGFGYRIVYVEPGHVAAALHDVCGRPRPLPFVREPVSADARLARAIASAFGSGREPLAIDAIIGDLAEGLLAAADGAALPAGPRRVDRVAVERARQFLDAERTRVVHSTELEAITGLTRYELARQFRLALGTSPYRYLLRRRLDLARQRLHADTRLVDVAGDAGFADQAHFTRTFKAAFGLTPARYRALRSARPAVGPRTSGGPDQRGRG
jgi:AraC-like DNA-binding protein